MKDERNLIVEYDDPMKPGAKPRAPRRSAKRSPREARIAAASDRGIASIMARMFLVGCALVLVGAVGDLLVLICKWIGGAIVIYVICGSAVRLVFEKWPEWVTRPCARIRAWLDQ
jgi:hypothetical protein